MSQSFRSGWRNDHKLLCNPQTCIRLSWEGGGGWYSIKFNTWRLRSPIPYIVCHFGEKDNPFLYLFKLMDNTRGEHQAFSKACYTQTKNKYYSSSSGCDRSQDDRFPYLFKYFDLSVNSLLLCKAEASPYTEVLYGSNVAWHMRTIDYFFLWENSFFLLLKYFPCSVQHGCCAKHFCT